mmetsp:Transcript_382/g.870  ORF Transcript_382/g.870 Transcript_382/m.870 type:complete len:276 (+) Transcript_382:670-1497(+)
MTSALFSRTPVSTMGPGREPTRFQKKAYESAETMSTKLETAVNKLMVAVSDRLERERIDHNNAEREIEAAERMEAARIRAQWNSETAPEGGKGDGQGGPQRVEGSLRVRSNARRSIRQSDTDFEVPFFEEDYDGQEQSYMEVMKQQKATFERQREELVAMRRSTQVIGLAVFQSRMQSELALQWVLNEQKRLGISVAAVTATKDAMKTSGIQGAVAASSSRGIPVPSAISVKLEKKDRVPVKMKLKAGSGKQRKKTNRKLQKASLCGTDWGDDDE